MKRYVYLLIIGFSFLLFYHFIFYLFTSKEPLVTLTDSDGPTNILKVEIVTSDEERQERRENQKKEESNAQAKAQAAAQNRQANAASQAAATRAAGSNPNPDTSPPLSSKECAADKAMVGSNTANLAEIYQLLQSGQSLLTSIQSPLNSNTVQIQDASGIINKFINEQMDAGKAGAACASQMKNIGAPTFKINSNPMNAAIQLFSGLTQSG